MTRHTAWPEALHAHIAERQRAKHEFGPNDCCSFVADAGVAMGCKDLLAGLRGYKTAAGALKALAKAGVGSVGELASARLEPIGGALAGRGDVAFVPQKNPFGGVLCIVEGATLCGPGEKGMMRYPRAAAAAFFRMD